MIRKAPSTSVPAAPTPGELAILQVLWAEGPRPVRRVYEVLEAGKTPGEKPTGYTTVLKLMQLMTEKGMLTRALDGQRHIYTAAVQRAPTQDRLLDTFLERAFSGSAKQLVMRALGTHTPSAEELDELKAYIAELERARKSSDS